MLAIKAINTCDNILGYKHSIYSGHIPRRKMQNQRLLGITKYCVSKRFYHFKLPSTVYKNVHFGGYLNTRTILSFYYFVTQLLCGLHYICLAELRISVKKSIIEFPSVNMDLSISLCTSLVFPLYISNLFY